MAMSEVGLGEKEIHWTWLLLTVILKLGNLNFGVDEEAKMPGASQLKVARRIEPGSRLRQRCKEVP